jgi:hypothetical protein
MRLVAALALVLAVALAGTACGGGNDEASGDMDTVVVTEPTTDDGDTTGLEGIASEDCLELIGIGAALSQAFTGAAGGAGNTDELLERLAARAPDEIRADLETLAGAYSRYAEVWEDVDLEPGQVPSGEDLQRIQAAIASIDQPGLQEASERVSAWAEENC